MIDELDIDPPFMALLLVVGAVVVALVACVFCFRGVSAEDHSDNVHLTQKCYEPRYVQLDEHQFQRLIEVLEKGDSK